MIWDRLIEACWQGTVAFAAIGLLVLCVRRMTPNMRAWLWRLCVLKLLVSLVAVVGVPLLPAQPAEAMPDWVPLLSQTPPIGEVPTKANPVLAGPDWPTILLIAWAVGVVAIIASRLVAEIRSKARIFRGTQPWEGDSGQVFELRRQPRIWVSDTVPSPLVTGIWRPSIVLPRSILSNPCDLKLALAHEVAHIRRNDLAWQAIMAITACLFWVLPVVHLAAKFAKEEAEMACDRLALSITGSSPARYSRLLVELAAHSPTTAGAVAMAARSRKNLEKRILTMNHRLRKMSRFSSLIALAVLVPAIVPWQAIAQETASSPKLEGKSLEDLAMRWLGVGGSDKELRYTPEQEAKFREMGKRHNDEVRAFGNKLEEMKRNKVSKEELFAYDESIRMPMFNRHHVERWEVLTFAQQERMKELICQYLGPMALGNEEVAKLVDLPENNRSAIARISAAYSDFTKKQQSKHFGVFRQRLEKNRDSNPHYTAADRKRIAELSKQLQTASGDRKTKIQAEMNSLRLKGKSFDGKSEAERLMKGMQVWNAAYTDKLMEERRKEFARMSQKAESLIPASSFSKWKALQGRPFTFVPHPKGRAAISYR